MPILSSDVFRCLNCRNRVGALAALLTDDGMIVCRRCAERREDLVGPGGTVHLVG